MPLCRVERLSGRKRDKACPCLRTGIARLQLLEALPHLRFRGGKPSSAFLTKGKEKLRSLPTQAHHIVNELLNPYRNDKSGCIGYFHANAVTLDRVRQALGTACKKVRQIGAETFSALVLATDTVTAPVGQCHDAFSRDAKSPKASAAQRLVADDATWLRGPRRSISAGIVFVRRKAWG